MIFFYLLGYSIIFSHYYICRCVGSMDFVSVPVWGFSYGRRRGLVGSRKLLDQSGHFRIQLLQSSEMT